MSTKKRYFFEIRKIVETGKMVIRELIFLCKYYIIMEPNEKKETRNEDSGRDRVYRSK